MPGPSGVSKRSDCSAGLVASVAGVPNTARRLPLVPSIARIAEAVLALSASGGAAAVAITLSSATRAGSAWVAGDRESRARESRSRRCESNRTSSARRPGAGGSPTVVFGMRARNRGLSSI